MTRPANRPKRDEAKGLVLAYLAQGFPIYKAMEKVGRTHGTYTLWRKEDQSFAEQAERVIRGFKHPEMKQGKDFIAFRRDYFGRETPSHHARMVDAIEGAAKEGRSTVSLILAPPEHGKSSVMVDYICWKLALNPNFRVCIVSENQDLAKKILGQIARRMTDDSVAPAFLRDFGPFKAPDRSVSKPWNTDRIYLINATHDEKDPSIEAKGAGSQIYGARYDMIVFDDIQSLKNLNASDALLTYTRQDALTRLGPTSPLIIVGTRIAQGDFYEKALDEDGFLDRYLPLPAISVDKHRIEHALWPEYWPLERLEERRKKVGPTTWSRVYMQEPVGDNLATFRPDDIERAYDPMHAVGERKGMDLICGLDPNVGIGYSAFVAYGYSPDKFWLVDCETHHGFTRTEQILERVAWFSQRYNPTVWRVEANAFQHALANDDRFQELSQQYGFTIDPHTTGRNKHDPVFGVASMAGSFSRNEFVLPAASDEDRKRVSDLADELLRWRGDVPTKMLKQDLVMATWFCWLHWRRIREHLARQRSRQWRPTWLADSFGSKAA